MSWDIARMIEAHGKGVHSGGVGEEANKLTRNVVKTVWDYSGGQVEAIFALLHLDEDEVGILTVRGGVPSILTEKSTFDSTLTDEAITERFSKLLGFLREDMESLRRSLERSGATPPRRVWAAYLTESNSYRTVLDYTLPQFSVPSIEEGVKRWEKTLQEKDYKTLPL